MKLKPATQEQLGHAHAAQMHLRLARDHLRRTGGAQHTTERVNLALSSMEGAIRHLERRVMLSRELRLVKQES